MLDEAPLLPPLEPELEPEPRVPELLIPVEVGSAPEEEEEVWDPAPPLPVVFELVSMSAMRMSVSL